jgi:hypothetical protein
VIARLFSPPLVHPFSHPSSLSSPPRSVTLLGPDDYLEMDLLYCKRGWAHEQTCHDLDVAGFFGETNATGFILPAEANATLASVDVRPMVYNMWKVVWGDSLYPTRGWDIPSFSIMYNSMLSMGCLIIIVMSKVLFCWPFLNGYTLSLSHRSKYPCAFIILFSADRHQLASFSTLPSSCQARRTWAAVISCKHTTGPVFLFSVFSGFA